MSPKNSVQPVPKWHMTAKLAVTWSNLKAVCIVLSFHLYIFRAWAPKRGVVSFLKRTECKWKSAICGEKNITPLLCDSSFQCKPLQRRSNSQVVCWFFFTEQVLLDQNVQTPPPSPFSIHAFSKGTSCSNGQGFDYGLGNNKGMFIHYFKKSWFS